MYYSVGWIYSPYYLCSCAPFLLLSTVACEIKCSTPVSKIQNELLIHFGFQKWELAWISCNNIVTHYLRCSGLILFLARYINQTAVTDTKSRPRYFRLYFNGLSFLPFSQLPMCSCQSRVMWSWQILGWRGSWQTLRSRGTHLSARLSGWPRRSLSSQPTTLRWGKRLWTSCVYTESMKRHHFVVNQRELNFDALNSSLCLYPLRLISGLWESPPLSWPKGNPPTLIYTPWESSS